MSANNRKLIPDVPTDHLTKAGIYAAFLRQGTTEEAKKAFRRQPYFKTTAEVKPVDEQVVKYDQNVYVLGEDGERKEIGIK